MLYLRNKLFLLLVIGCVGNMPLYAQQFTQFSNYLMNSVAINPAYTGSKGVTELMGSYRRQWSEIEGSPSTYNLLLHTKLEQNQLGIGGSILKDKIGVSETIITSAMASYSIDLDRFKLSFGLSAGMYAFSANLNQVKTITEDDPAFVGEASTKYLPQIGTGFFIHDETSYLGFSAPDIIESNNNYINKERHYYLSLGKVFELSEAVQLKPSMLVKFTESTNPQFDLSATFIVKKIVGFGASHRIKTGNILFVQLFPSQKWSMAYAYDSMSNGLKNSDGNTHEITLIYKFIRTQKTIITPRYF